MASTSETGRGSRPQETVLNTLFRENAGRLAAFVSRRTGGGNADVDDVVQEAMIRAWQNNAESGAIRPGWLTTTAARISIDIGRKRARRKEIPLFTTDGATSPAPDAELVQKHLVQEALATLSPKHRAIMILLHIQGYTARDAAQRLGIPESTLKERATYAKTNLIAALAERGITNPNTQAA